MKDTVHGHRHAFAQRHPDLYHDNVFYKNAVDTLARMLPLWADGLAEQARNEQHEWEQKYMDILYNGQTSVPLGGPL